MSANDTRMTKGERADLLSLVRKRERVMKSMAAERSAQMLAEFEAQAAAAYSFNDDAVWAAAQREAAEAVRQAAEMVVKRCEALGIPKEFAPTLNLSWYGRGENAFVQRMAELRRAAKKRIEAMEAQAVASIERLALEAQTTLLAHGIDTDAAHAFLAKTQEDMATFMPSLAIADVEQMLVSSARRRMSPDDRTYDPSANRLN